MNKTLKTIATVLGIGALLYWFNEKKAVNNIRVSLRGAKFSNGQLRLILQVVNPSNVAITVNNILGDIFYNGNQVATVVNFKKQGIAAGAFSDVDVILQISPMALINFLPIIRNAINTGFKGIKLTFKGTVRANNIVIPIEQTTTLS